MVGEGAIPSEEVPLQMDLFARHATQVDFFTILDQHANAASSLTIWVPSSGRVNSGNQRT